MNSPRFILTLLVLASEVASLAQGSPPVRTIAYHGWDDCLLLANGKIEVVIVPNIGRIMQIRFVGDDDGVLWENRALDGKSPDPKSKEWGNFGGDKTWPAPQSDWPVVTDRSWPPPVAFDSMSVKAESVRLPSGETAVRMESAVDLHYGIQTTRWVSLAPNEAKVHIRTEYAKVEGQPGRVGVWVISQLKHPVAVFGQVTTTSDNPLGYNKQSDALPLGLKVADGLLSLQRDSKTPTKIGTEAGELLWIGDHLGLLIASPRMPNREYPDHGSSAEVYTNPDPLPYVELELLGPLDSLKVGEKIERTSTYTLFRRIESDVTAEARRVFRTR